jgi:hypothetical protein
MNLNGNKMGKNDFIDEIIVIFCSAYKEANDVEYHIVSIGKERSMAGKLAREYRKQYPESNTEQTYDSFKIYFKACCHISDPWLNTNMSLSIIVSKFNEINRILHGNNKKISRESIIQLTELNAKYFPGA